MRSSMKSSSIDPTKYLLKISTMYQTSLENTSFIHKYCKGNKYISDSCIIMQAWSDEMDRYLLASVESYT